MSINTNLSNPIIPIATAMSEQKKDPTANQAENYSKLLNCSIDLETAELMDDSIRVFGHSIDVAYRVVKQLKESKLSINEIKKLARFIEIKKQEFQKNGKFQKNQGPVYVKARDYPDDIPRNLQFLKDGRVYLLLNRVSTRGDVLLGKGVSRTGKYALNLLDGQMDARLTSHYRDEQSAKDIAMSKKLGTSDRIALTDPTTVVLYQSKFGGLKIGYMQKLFNGGSASTAIYANDRRLNPLKYPAPSEEEKLVIAEHFLEGLTYLHSQGIIHEDLKPDNLLLSRDPLTKKITSCGIGDLGLSCHRNVNDFSGATTGSGLYLPPESLRFRFDPKWDHRKNPSDYSKDNWSAGVILYLLFKGDISEWSALPDEPFWFSSFGYEDLYENLLYITLDTFPEPSDPHSLGHVIRGLLNPNMQERMTASQALNKVKEVREARKCSQCLIKMKDDKMTFAPQPYYKMMQALKFKSRDVIEEAVISIVKDKETAAAEAEEALKDAQVGTFLVRSSSCDNFITISVKNGKGEKDVLHHRIEKVIIDQGQRTEKTLYKMFPSQATLEAEAGIVVSEEQAKIFTELQPLSVIIAYYQLGGHVSKREGELITVNLNRTKQTPIIYQRFENAILSPNKKRDTEEKVLSNLNRNQAEQYLNQPGIEEGSFIFRQASDPGKIAISIKVGNDVQHTTIMRDIIMDEEKKKVVAVSYRLDSTKEQSYKSGFSYAEKNNLLSNQSLGVMVKYLELGGAYNFAHGTLKRVRLK